MPLSGVSAGAVSVIQEHELAREGMLVRCELLAKQTERLVAITFRHVAEIEVVRVILLDHVNDVFEYRRLTHALRHRHWFRIGPSRCLVRFPQIVRSDLLGECGQVAPPAPINKLHRPDRRGRKSIILVTDPRPETFAAGHEEGATALRDRSGKPPSRDVPYGFQLWQRDERERVRSTAGHV